MQRALRLVSNQSSQSTGAAPPILQSDDDLLDAYSAAVTAAAERVSPSVVNVEVRQRADSRQPWPSRPVELRGSGSGVVFAPGGFIPSTSNGVAGARQELVTAAARAAHRARS